MSTPPSSNRTSITYRITNPFDETIDVCKIKSVLENENIISKTDDKLFTLDKKRNKKYNVKYYLVDGKNYMKKRRLI